MALMKLAFEDGIVIEKTDDGVTVSNRFKQGGDEQWRIDLRKVETDAQDNGEHISFDIAWKRNAKEQLKRVIQSDRYQHPKGNPKQENENEDE